MTPTLSKTTVNYREAKGVRHCGNCGMFHGGRCDLVKGVIHAEYVCDKWVKK